jgi:hypothetical protein
MTDTPTAAAKSRELFTDADLKATLDGRIRQLEGDLEGQLMLADEAAADPHDETSEKQHRESAESLTARLEVVRKRRKALGK